MSITDDWQDKLKRELVEKGPALGEEFGFSMAAGYATGTALRVMGKITAVALGGAFVFLQSLAYSGYVQVDWGKMENEYRQLLDLDGDGKVTTADAAIVWEKLKNVLLFNLPSGAGFTGGLIYGMGGSLAAAGKIGLGMGMTGIATRGLLVTGAPAVFSVAAEYDDGRIKHALDQGKEMLGAYGLNDYWQRAKGIAGNLGTLPPEVQMELFKNKLAGQSLDALRNIEVDLHRKWDGKNAALLEQQLQAIKRMKQEVKLAQRKGWFR